MNVISTVSTCNMILLSKAEILITNDGSMNIIETLLCNDCEMGRYTRAVSGQWFGKHIPRVTDTNVTIEELCFLCGMCRDFISKGQG
jgi:hypothetical protein